MIGNRLVDDCWLVNDGDASCHVAAAAAAVAKCCLPPSCDIPQAC